jgi:MFS family permease
LAIAMPPLIRRLLAAAALDVRPLRHRDLRLLLSGTLVSSLGAQLTVVALPYQVYQLTRSTLALGLVGLVQLGPVLACALWGGALADARDRRLMVLLTEAAFAVVSLLLLLNALLPRPALWAIFVLAAVQGGLFALQRPSLDALLPRLVPAGELTAVGALSIAGGELTMVLGPPVAGLLIAGWGVAPTYAVDVATFAGSLAALWLMRAVPPPAGAARPSLRRVVEGLRYAGGRGDLLGTYLTDLVAMVFGMPSALFPAIADRLGGPAVLGLLWSAVAAGGAAALATSGWTSRVRRQGWGVILAAAAWGLGVTLFGLAPSLLLALLALALAGASDAVSGIFRMAIWNRSVPDELRGRLASIELVSYSAGPLLGDFEAGGVAALAGVRASVVSGGILCVVGTLLCALLLPAFRDYDAGEP